MGLAECVEPAFEKELNRDQVGLFAFLSRFVRMMVKREPVYDWGMTRLRVSAKSGNPAIKNHTLFAFPLGFVHGFVGGA